MAQDMLKDGRRKRFFRGKLHCHSDRSDGLSEPKEVVAAYRGAGYDFLCLSDHFEEEYGWRVTDTRSWRDENFTTILGAELSSAPWDERHCYWVTAAGLPLDFGAPPPDDHAEAIRRATDVGALVVMLHPGLNNLPLAAADGLPALEAVHAVEVYNHNCAMDALPDRANGAYMLDGLLEKGHRLLVKREVHVQTFHSRGQLIQRPGDGIERLRGRLLRSVGPQNERAAAELAYERGVRQLEIAVGPVRARRPEALHGGLEAAYGPQLARGQKLPRSSSV